MTPDEYCQPAKYGRASRFREAAAAQARRAAFCWLRIAR